MKKKTILTGLVMGFLMLGTGNAATWDATNDFTTTTTTNPNGVWSYGYDPASTPDYQFKPFDLFSLYPGYGPLWTDSTYNSYNCPQFSKNLSDLTQYGVPSGAINIHPGPNPYADGAILRFTAPTTSRYDINAQFFAGYSGETDAAIIKNNDADSLLSYLGITSLNPVYSIKGLPLEAGDTIDFFVGSYGNYGGDNTPLSVQVSSVPLPAAGWLFGTGLLTIVGVLKKRQFTQK